MPFPQTHTAVRFSERLTNVVATGLWPVHLSCGFCKANGPQGRGYSGLAPATHLLRNPVNGLVADAALNLSANPISRVSCLSRKRFIKEESEYRFRKALVNRIA